MLLLQALSVVVSILPLFCSGCMVDEYNTTPPDCNEWVNWVEVDRNEAFLFPHMRDCNLYWMCEPHTEEYGKPCLRPCPAGLFFNPDIAPPMGPVCDWPRNVKCNNTPDVCNKCDYWQTCVEDPNSPDGWTCTPDCMVDEQCGDCGSCVSNQCVASECCDDSDCTASACSTCADNQCFNPECCTDDDCGAMSCSTCGADSQCHDPECCAHTDCQADEYCTDNNECAQGCRDDAACSEFGDCSTCGADNVCSQPECCYNNDCDGCSICLDDNTCSNPECCTHTDCQDDEYCTDNDECAKGCRDDASCSQFGDCSTCGADNVCSQPECCADADCPACSSCNGNQCETTCIDEEVCFEEEDRCVECIVDSDCESTDICQDHECVDPPKPGGTYVRFIKFRTESCDDCATGNVEGGPKLTLEFEGSNHVSCETKNFDHEYAADFASGNSVSFDNDHEGNGDGEMFGTCRSAGLNGIDGGTITWTGQGTWKLQDNKAVFEFNKESNQADYACCVDQTLESFKTVTFSRCGKNSSIICN